MYSMCILFFIKFLMRAGQGLKLKVPLNFKVQCGDAFFDVDNMCQSSGFTIFS